MLFIVRAFVYSVFIVSLTIVAIQATSVDTSGDRGCLRTAELYVGLVLSSNHDMVHLSTCRAFAHFPAFK